MIYELHTHSTFSDGANTPKQIVEHAMKALDGIAITDHNVIEGSLEALKYAAEGFEVITGVEVSSTEGHILALGVSENVERDKSVKETIDAIHSLGGIAIAAHPYDRYRKGVGDEILRNDFDAVEVMNGHTFGNRKNVRKLCEQSNIPMVGGSDAHTIGEIGSVTIEFEGDWRQAIKTGKVRIRSWPRHRIFLNHWAGIVKRKLL